MGKGGGGVSSSRVLPLGHGHQRWANHTVVQFVTLLQDSDNSVWLGVGFNHADRLMFVRVKLLRQWIFFGKMEFIERRFQLLQCQFYAAFEVFSSGIFRSRSIQSRFQTVLDRQQLGGEIFHRILVRGGDIGLCALANVVGFGFGTQECVAMLLNRGFGDL